MSIYLIVFPLMMPVHVNLKTAAVYQYTVQLPVLPEGGESYSLLIREAGSSAAPVPVVQLPGNAREYELNSLIPGVDYELQIEAMLRGGSRRTLSTTIIKLPGNFLELSNFQIHTSKISHIRILIDDAPFLDKKKYKMGNE